MIRIKIKKGNIDAALEEFNAAKKEQNRKFDEQVAAFFAPKAEAEVEVEVGKKPAPRAPSYQSILSRSRRIG